MVSSKDTNNGIAGFFDVPLSATYERGITVACDGKPLTAKFHPYRFSITDRVAVLLPRQEYCDTTLFYIAGVLNRMRWRYSYGRKCFGQKMPGVMIPVPIIKKNGKELIDENYIKTIFSKVYKDFIPPRKEKKSVQVPDITWKYFTITDIFDLDRGDFHSLSILDSGPNLTVSRVSTHNGVVGRFASPDRASIYPHGHITISTVGGDAFVQLDKFIATDNVVICIPKKSLRITSLFFITFMLNQQKWRYSYGRQCYKTKLASAKFYLPITAEGELNEDIMQRIVEQTSYWHLISRQFDAVP